MGKLLLITLACALIAGVAVGSGIFAADGNTVMIHGLDGYAVISHEEAAGFPDSDGIVELTIDGERLPYDAASNTYFIPQTRESEFFEGTIEVAEQPGYEYYICMYDNIDKIYAIDGSIGYNIYGVSEAGCVSSKFIFTPVPVVCITTDDSQLPGDEYSAGQINVFTAGNGDITVSGSDMEIKIRGNTSRWFPKKSYRIKLVDEYGGNNHMSIAGLRMDDDWILNAMYTDASKIREKLAYELWDIMNSSGDRANSSRLEHVEVFINGEYWGLYGMQERIDNKQVNGDKRADILYKIFANDMPTVEQLSVCTDRTVCGGFEVQGDTFNGTVQQLWAPAAAFMSMLYGETVDNDCYIDVNNAVDYGLWAMCAQAFDCHFKNQFINCVYENGVYTMYKIPWDLNHTFGDVWMNDAPEVNYSGYEIGSIVMDDLFAVLIDSGDSNVIFATQSRWYKLRLGPLSDENLIGLAEDMFCDVAPAVERDSHRWPQCGMGDGNNTDVSDITGYIKYALPLVDDYVEALGK